MHPAYCVSYHNEIKMAAFPQHLRGKLFFNIPVLFIKKLKPLTEPYRVRADRFLTKKIIQMRFYFNYYKSVC